MTQPQLETIEWTQYWSEAAPDRKTPRVLLIGDSISVGYRHLVEEQLEGRYHISSMATSKALDNPWFLKEIALYHEQEGDFEIVHINNGAHGGHLDAAAYQAAYEELLEGIKEMLPQAGLIMALTTPVMRKDNLASTDPDGNGRVLIRNERALAVADKFGIKTIDDLYRAALSEPALHAADGLHFTERGYRVLAESVAASILKMAK